jgi:hypothetical protein
MISALMTALMESASEFWDPGSLVEVTVTASVRDPDPASGSSLEIVLSCRAS